MFATLIGKTLRTMAVLGISFPGVAETTKLAGQNVLEPGQWTTRSLDIGVVATHKVRVSTPGVIAITVQELDTSNPCFDVWWVLVDPSGNLVGLSTCQAEVVCRIAGSYTLYIVDAEMNDSGSYGLCVQGISEGTSSGKRILSAADKLTGSLAEWGKTDAWALSVEEPGIMSFNLSVLQSIDKGFELQWRLYSPSGVIVSAGSGEGRVNCEESGVHTLFVFENGWDQRGTYELTIGVESPKDLGPSEQLAQTGPSAAGSSALPMMTNVAPMKRFEVAVPLNFGQSVAGSIEQGNEVDGYFFDAVAGDRVKVRFARTSASGFSLSLRIDDRFGSPVAASVGSFGELDATVPLSGRYYLSVRGPGAATGTYQLTLQRTVNPGNVEAVTIGDSVARSTVFWTEVDVFEFAGTAGENLFLRFARTSASGFSLQLDLRDSTGILVDSSGPSSSGTFETSIASTGQYFLWVYNPGLELGNGGATGSYQVTLERTVNPVNVELISIGDSIARSTSFWTEIDVFEFAGAGGDDLFVRFARTSASGFSLQVDLRDSSGALVASSGPASSGTFEPSLTLSGQYFLWVFNPQLGIGAGGAAGDYQLTLQRTENPVGVVQSDFGDSFAESTNFWTEVGVYEFAATAGDRLFLPFARTTGFGFSLQLDLRDSFGVLVDSSGPVAFGVFEPIVPATGQYFLWVFNPGLEIGGGGATGSYHLTLQRTVEPGQVTSIVIGGPAMAGAISFRTEVDIYSFTGSAGTDIDVPFSRTSASGFTLEVRLYDDSGSQVVPLESGTSGLLEAMLPTNGTYYLWVRNPSLNVTGTYSFSLL